MLESLNSCCFPLVKRLFDIVFSVIMLILLLPIFFLVGLAVFLDDGFPVFFLQDRVGRDGRVFVIFKFRSMIDNARNFGDYSTINRDPRITHVGRFIRRTSLDEIPQLLNVLRGDMSLVGPRPDVPEQVGLYSELDWILRHKVRPGITGLAQSTLRSSATPDQRKLLDLEYSKKMSLCLDMKIVLLTLRQLIVVGGN